MITLKGKAMRKRRAALIAALSIVLLTASLYMLAGDLLWFHRSAVYASANHVRIPVLCYHSISDKHTNKFIVAPLQFDRQMKFLHDHGYHSLNMKQFGAILHGTRADDGKSVLITFDDGYMDNYTNAYPILRRYGYTATEFVVTNWANGGVYMSWDRIAELQHAGWDIMSHTRTHPYLSLQSDQAQQHEIAGSKRAIEHRLSSKVSAFAYPYGFRSQETVDLVGRSGYSYAFTFDEGFTDSSQNPYLLTRLFVSGEEDLAAFERQMHRV